MTRRQLLGAAGAASALLSLKPGWAQPSGKPIRNMGGAPAGFPVRSRASRGGAKPFDFVEYCHSLGFGVVETRLPPTDPESIKAFRQKIEGYNMRVILEGGQGVWRYLTTRSDDSQALRGVRHLRRFQAELRTSPEVDCPRRAGASQI